MSSNNIYNEQELLHGITEGDEKAFTACVYYFTPQLFPFIKSIVQSEFWAEDLLQNLYTKLWASRAQLSAVENLGGYLNRMASNMALDFLKHRSVEVKAQYRMEREIVNSVHEQGGEKYDRQYYTKLLSEAVQQLTPQQQRIYRLRYEEAFSYDKIAEELSISRNTVRNHLVALMEIVRGYLKEHAAIFVLTSGMLENFLK